MILMFASFVVFPNSDRDLKRVNSRFSSTQIKHGLHVLFYRDIVFPFYILRQTVVSNTV